MQLVLKESWKIHYLIWGGWFLMIYFHVTQYRGWIFGFCVSIYNFGSKLVLLVSAKLFSYPCACVVLTTAALWVKLFFFVLSSLHGGTSSDGELCLGKASSNITVPSSKIGYFMHNLILIQVKRHISRSALCSYFFKWQHFSSWQRTKGVSGFPIHCPPVSCLLGSKSSISKLPEKTWMWILFLWKEESLSALMHQPLPVSSFNQY